MSSETTVKCQLCGDPYKFYPFYAGDQSACPQCVAKAESKGKPVQGGWGQRMNPKDIR